MENLGYYNGKYGLLEEMSIPMNDRGCWFGDGVYDAGPCRNRKIFASEEHIDRFFRNAEKLDIQIPVSKEELNDLLNELVMKLDSSNLFVYYQVTRGTAIRDHVYESGPGNLWIMMKPAGPCQTQVPLKLITVEDTRFFHCDIKTLNLIPAVMASQKAKLAGCDEAVLYRPGGRVTECAHSNVHILKDGVLHTAPTDNLILPGIGRKHLIAACGRVGVPVVEEPFFLEDLFDADEVIVTSSGQYFRFACEIDGKPVGCKDEKNRKLICDEVSREFEEATQAD